MGPLLRAPAVARVVDTRLVHGKKLHAAEAEIMGRLNFSAKRLISVQALCQPPAQFGTKFNGGICEIPKMAVEF